MITRRELLPQLATITALISFASRASASPSAPHVMYWLKRTEALTAMLRGETITIQEWRSGLEQLNKKIDLDALLLDLGYEDIISATRFPELGVSSAKVDLGDHDIRELSFYPKIFAVNKGRAIIPHGHANMVSAHFVTSGRFHLRQYDKVHLDENTMTVRPSFEGEIVSGELSSIGEHEDNVHWFVALEQSFTLDVIVTGIEKDTSPNYNIYNLDMDRAQKDGELLRVPRLGIYEALQKYG